MGGKHCRWKEQGSNMLEQQCLIFKRGFSTSQGWLYLRQTIMPCSEICVTWGAIVTPIMPGFDSTWKSNIWMSQSLCIRWCLLPILQGLITCWSSKPARVSEGILGTEVPCKCKELCETEFIQFEKGIWSIGWERSLKIKRWLSWCTFSPTNSYGVNFVMDITVKVIWIHHRGST